MKISSELLLNPNLTLHIYTYTIGSYLGVFFAMPSEQVYPVLVFSTECIWKVSRCVRKLVAVSSSVHIRAHLSYTQNQCSFAYIAPKRRLRRQNCRWLVAVSASVHIHTEHQFSTVYRRELMCVKEEMCAKTAAVALIWCYFDDALQWVCQNPRHIESTLVAVPAVFCVYFHMGKGEGRVLLICLSYRDRLWVLIPFKIQALTFQQRVSG